MVAMSAGGNSKIEAILELECRLLAVDAGLSCILRRIDDIKRTTDHYLSTFMRKIYKIEKQM